MYRILYSLVFYLALPFILLRLLIRSIRAPDYRRRLPERLALKALPTNFDKTKQTLWIHSVSVGETVAAAPLVHQLQEKYPEIQLFISTMTPTGSDRVRELFADGVFHRYIPYDLPGATRRIIRQLQPSVLILMETELWPNLIHYSHKSGVKILLANGRLSEKSAAGYGRFPHVTEKMLNKIDCIAAQSREDAARFTALGMDEARVHISGSLKFNIELQQAQPASASLFTSIKNSNRSVLIAASTRDGEEAKVLRAFDQCLQSYPDLILLLVPRHPERFDRVARLCEERGYITGRRSRDTLFTSDMQILLGDSMGEMLAYYRLADIAFVGGSLVDTGCQNVLEPAALGIPVVTGPSQFNFATICRQLESAAALKTVANETELASYLLELLADKSAQRKIGERGRQLVEANQDALPKLLRLLEPLIADRS